MLHTLPLKPPQITAYQQIALPLAAAMQKLQLKIASIQITYKFHV